MGAHLIPSPQQFSTTRSGFLELKDAYRGYVIVKDLPGVRLPDELEVRSAGGVGESVVARRYRSAGLARFIAGSAQDIYADTAGYVFEIERNGNPGASVARIGGLVGALTDEIKRRYAERAVARNAAD